MALCFGATDTNIQENLFTFGKTGDEAMAAILTNHEKQRFVFVRRNVSVN